MEINENKEVTETDNEELFVDAVNDAPPPQDAMTTTTEVVEEEGGYDDDVVVVLMIPAIATRS